MTIRRSRPRHALRRTGVAVFLASVIFLGGGTAVWVAADQGTTTTSTTTTTVPAEAAETGWTVVATSARGVMVDRREVTVSGAVFTVVRFRQRTTALHWHAGSEDPPRQTGLPADSGSHIAWGTENVTGIVGVFNGGFKAGSDAGGILADGLKLKGLAANDATIAIDTAGKLHIGMWGHGTIPLAPGNAVAYRQNLPLLVLHGAPTPLALSPSWGVWGAPLHAQPHQARTGIGVDAAGNAIYVATMAGVMPADVARAEVAAGVQTGMQLDMNPYWPIMGAGPRVFTPAGGFPLTLPGSKHSPTVYFHGWTRDFFSVIAEPNAWTCNISYAGWASVSTIAVPQVTRLSGSNCPVPTSTSPVSTTTVK